MDTSFRVSSSTIYFFLFLSLSNTAVFSTSVVVEAYDPYDPTSNITIKWDVLSWTSDGYLGVVTITNNQIYRTVQKPGWKLGWTWAGREVVWSMVGAQAIDQGDCSRFKGNIPHSCLKTPTMVDLMPGTPFNQQVKDCCKGGTLTTRYQDVHNSVASFQISVGNAGTSNTTVRMPKKFTFVAGHDKYNCRPAKTVPSTRFITSDGRRMTRAFMTWKVVCTHSRAKEANKHPACCVSFSGFDQHKKANCPPCACGCRNKTCNPSARGLSFVPSQIKCTDHMCPVNINWQIMKPKEKGVDWTVNVSITNFNYRMNYLGWTLLVNHPFINKLTEVLHAKHRQLTNFTNAEMLEIIWGAKHKSDVITATGRKGSTVSWIMHLYKNDTATLSCEKDWCTPREVFFNGDRCVISSLLPLASARIH
ncbi:hypothetical protein MKW92_043348 [Papaver armeniacum]|nr:hypothetical protein MKW92_043348 [Papaver armeniacum]